MDHRQWHLGESGAWGGADGAGDDVRLTRATHCAMPETGQAAKMSADCRLAEEQQICVSVQQMVGAQRVNHREPCSARPFTCYLMCGEAAGGHHLKQQRATVYVSLLMYRIS